MIILWIVIVILTCALGVAIWLLYKMSQQQDELQDDLVECYHLMYDYQQVINKLFEMNIHYYDDTIFQFIERTKAVRDDIEKILKKHEELELQVLPDEPPTEQPQELLGISRPLIYNRRIPTK
jgi:hypothetical protein